MISARVTKAVRYGAQGLGVPSACRSLGIVMTSNVCLGAIGGRPKTNDHSLHWISLRADPPQSLVGSTYLSAIINSHQPVTRSSRSTFGMLSHFIHAGSRCIPIAWAERTALQRRLVSIEFHSPLSTAAYPPTSFHPSLTRPRSTRYMARNTAAMQLSTPPFTDPSLVEYTGEARRMSSVNRLAASACMKYPAQFWLESCVPGVNASTEKSRESQCGLISSKQARQPFFERQDGSQRRSR